MYNNWYNNRNTFAVFLDIRGAYDNVLWDILISKLDMKLSPLFIKFIFNLISFREMQFKFNNIDVVRHVYKELPQGCVLHYTLSTSLILKLKFSVHLILELFNMTCVYTSLTRIESQPSGNWKKQGMLWRIGLIL